MDGLLISQIKNVTYTHKIIFMNNSIENLLRNILKKVNPNYEILKKSQQDKNITVESANKIDIYQEYVRLLSEKLYIKNRKIEELTRIEKEAKAASADNKLYILDIQEQVIQLQTECMDLEIEIMAKKYYTNVYTERMTEYKNRQQQIYDESKKHFKKYIDVASNIISLNHVSQKDKQILSGIISKYYNGINDIEASNQMFIQLKDHIHRIDSMLNRQDKVTEAKT